MPIDFRCTQCGKLLRVGDESAGKKSRCPDCGNIQEIPGASDSAPAGPSSYPGPAPGYSSDPIGSSSGPGPVPMSGSPLSGGGNPFQQAAGGSNPYAAPMSGQPYPGGAYAGALPEHVALGRVQAPAILMIVLTILALLLMSFLCLGFVAMTIEGDLDEEDVPAMIMVIASIPLRIVVLLGAISMLRLRNYPLSVAAAVITIIPCCFCIDVPIGIWALVILCDAGVRAAFK